MCVFVLVFAHSQTQCRVEDWRKGRGDEMDRQGTWPYTHVNVITVLIREPVNLKEERQTGRQKNESFRCIQMSACPHHHLPTVPRHLIAPSILSSVPMSCLAIVYAGLFNSNTSLRKFLGITGAWSYRIQPKQLHLNPEGQTHWRTDLSFTLVLLLYWGCGIRRFTTIIDKGNLNNCCSSHFGAIDWRDMLVLRLHTT